MSQYESNCAICKQKMKYIFSEKIMFKYDIDFLLCESCDFIQTENPYWLEEAYKQPINKSDTGLVERNLRICKLLYLLIKLCFDEKQQWIDVGGGYGLLTRLMRDLGIDFYWYDLYTDNIFAKEFDESKVEENKEVSLSFFEVFEHDYDIISSIKHWQSKFLIENIVFSTLIKPEHVPNKSWWYYGFDHGQHISFYSEKSLNLIAQKLGFNYLKLFDNFHIFTTKKCNPMKLFFIKSKIRELIFFYLKYKASSFIHKDHERVKNRDNKFHQE